MSDTLPILYTHEDSGNSYKVRLLASLINCPLNIVEVAFNSGEHKSPKFLELNPRGTIPVLKDGELVLTDSTAILIYLASKWSPPSSFWSVNAPQQAAIIEWLAFASGDIQYGLATARCMVSFGAPYYGLGTEWTDQTLKEAQIRSRNSLEFLQKHLSTRDWLALERPTVAEAAVFPYVALAHMANFDIKRYPAIVSWVQRVMELPGFVSMKGIKGA